MYFFKRDIFLKAAPDLCYTQIKKSILNEGEFRVIVPGPDFDLVIFGSSFFGEGAGQGDGVQDFLVNLQLFDVNLQLLRWICRFLRWMCSFSRSTCDGVQDFEQGSMKSCRISWSTCRRSRNFT